MQFSALAPGARASRARAVCLLLVAVAAALVSCGPVADSRGRDVDLLPPQVQSVQAEGPTEISVTFDEAAALCEGKTRISPALAVTVVPGGGPDLAADVAADAGPGAASGNRVTLRGQSQVPGQRYVLEAEARDLHGNTAGFAAEFYGYNARVPPLLINEFTPRGSGSHPDAVELKTLAGGNLGGVVLVLGSPERYDARLVFPPIEVGAGSFIVVHLRPTGDPAEIDETSDCSASGGSDASRTAWDLWMRDSPGLPGNNGALAVCDRPGGRCADAVLWSNRTSQSDEEYAGFGSEQMRARAEELARCGAWAATGGTISPEDAVNPEGSTGTRSICRAADGTDTNAAEDWHIVPTRKATLGSENSSEVYAP